MLSISIACVNVPQINIRGIKCHFASSPWPGCCCCLVLLEQGRVADLLELSLLLALMILK